MLRLSLKEYLLSNHVDMLQNMFAGIEPVINKAAGGSEYREELISIIKEACSIRPEDIRINDVYKNTEGYKTLISRI